MKILNYLIIIFICINPSVKADSKQTLINELQKGGKLIFIRHAYAPGGGDPDNFDINDCASQRNLSQNGIKQSKKIGNFFKENNISIDLVLSSEWCRCKDTAKYAFGKYKTFKGLNSFYDHRFHKFKTKQINELKKFIQNWDNKKNLVLVTHYVVILEILGLSASSGEIIISSKNLDVIKSINILN